MVMADPAARSPAGTPRVGPGVVLRGGIPHRPPMTEGSTGIDVGDDDFEREVLERSAERPVVVDFWAPWCGPCRTLGPLLEGLAEEYADAVRLAKLNVDEAPVVAQRLGIRSIPTVLAFRDGRAVAEFVGAQPESVVRRFFEALLPTEADQLAKAGEELARSGQGEAAEERFRGALEKEARHDRALLGLARLLAERGANEEALALLDRIVPGGATEHDAEHLAAELRTRARGGEVDSAGLRARVEADPGDLAARLELGRALAAEGSFEEALTELMAVVERDAGFSDEAARKAMLDVFELLGNDHPATQRFRTRLARALFR